MPAWVQQLCWPLPLQAEVGHILTSLPSLVLQQSLSFNLSCTQSIMSARTGKGELGKDSIHALSHL